MKKRLVIVTVFLCLGLMFGAGLRPAYAGALPEKPCNGVDFYIYNAIDSEVYIDLSNWTTYNHYYMNTLVLGDEAKFTAPAGVIEFYVDGMGPIEFQLDDWSYFENCSRVAYYIKLVNGEPTLKIKAILP